MSTITALINKHPVLICDVLPFVISWGCMFLVWSRAGNISPSKEQADRLIPQMTLLLAVDPFVASLIANILIVLAPPATGFDSSNLDPHLGQRVVDCCCSCAYQAKRFSIR